MPKKIVFNCATGASDEVEMTGAELQAHARMLGNQETAAAARAAAVAEASRRDTRRADLKKKALAGTLVGAELQEALGLLLETP